MHTKSKRNPIVANWGVENETIVFLINEGLNRECCHDNKRDMKLRILGQITTFGNRACVK